MKLTILRPVPQLLVLSSAVIWLGLNAYHLLATNFEHPFVLTWWVTWIGQHQTINSLAHWLANKAWPWLLIVLVVVLRQEAHRWFRIRRGRRSADRLLVAWFVFIGTILILDWFAPSIAIRWPTVVIETSVWLLTFCAAAWVSRLVHPASRRRLKTLTKRWHLGSVLDGLIKALTSRGEHSTMRKGERRYAHPNKSKRRAG